MMRILSCGRKIILPALLMCAMAAPAQKSNQQIEEAKARVQSDPRVKTVVVSPERGTPSFITFHDNQQAYTKAEAGNALGRYLGVRSGMDNLIPDREVPLHNGMAVQEFRQYFKGIKVEHARFSSLLKSNQVRFFNGAFFDIPATLSTHPKLSESQALQFAKAVVGATVYAWDELQKLVNQTADAGLKAKLQEELNDASQKGELVIVKDFRNNAEAQMHLAYKFNIYSYQPLSRQWVYVEANTGEILLVDKIIKHVDKENPGTPAPPASVSTQVQTRYAGVRNIFVKQISGNDPNSGQTLVASNPYELGYTPGGLTYALIDDTRGTGIETYDLNGVGGLPVSVAIAYSAARSFTDMDNNWTLAEHKRGNTIPTQPVESENDDIAWDAHWGAGVVYDYWRDKHNRLSFDGKDAKIKSYIHSGLAYDNAFWNGKVMTYGDGSYPAKSNGFLPLTSLDVCGHEIGHGICSFTSDLVYAMESGAMNEGLSDIWAACIEYYANKKFGTTYKPFYIGEQISPNPAVPLRRMDNPQARNNPDTYGGNRWTNQACTPTIANDQCGVHNNSGVLNKWFYLLTVGSGAGSGPDASYAGEDDGVNDLGNAYTVTGLGFDISEKIVYATELLLSSTATFAEARAVSIQVATNMSGSSCSDMVRTVTNAWYAVGVGAAFDPACKVSFGFVTQPGVSVSEGQSGAGCTAEYEVKVPVLMPANSTGSIALSGTATKDADYRIATTALSNTTSLSKLVYVSVFVKNDGVIEGDETIDLTLTLTNVGTNTLNNKFRINIIEDDVLPVLGTGSKQLLSENFNSVANGFNLAAGWAELTGAEGSGATGENLNHWGVWNGKLMVTGKLDKGNSTTLPAGNYNNLSPTSSIVKSPLIDARGLSNLNISFKFRVQGEVDPNGAEIEQWGLFDYMAVVYSFDGVTFYELTQADGFGGFASLAPKDGTVQGTLPSYLTNKTFYLGFKWFNDTNAGGPESVQVDDVVVTGTPRRMENDLNDNGSEQLRASQKVYFYSMRDSELLGSIDNTSTKNFGCTNLKIAKTGSSTFVMDLGNAGKVTAAEKSVGITTEIANKVNTTVTLYFTEAQLAALENATKASRSTFTIYQVNATDVALANSSNTSKITATYTGIAGVGGSYAFVVGNKLGGSIYVIGVGVAPAKGGGKNQRIGSEVSHELTTSWKFSNIYPNPVVSGAYVDITAPQNMRVRMEYISVNGQLVNVQQENVSAGSNRIQLNLQTTAKGSYMVRFRDESGSVLDTKQFVKQ